MSPLKPIPPTKIIQKFKKLGFEEIRQKGSHIIFKHPDGRRTVVPFHKGEDISKGLLHAILYDIQINASDFNRI